VATARTAAAERPLLRSGVRAPALAAGGLCTALLVVWLLAGPRTPDLAAATYRADLFGRSGFALWDVSWYGGHLLPAYSLLFAPLGWLLGVRLLGALAALASVVLFERLLRDAYGVRARWAAAWFAVAAVGDVWIGRVAFALGVTFALAAVLAWRRTRPTAAVALALLCTAASPVAGALLALAAVTAALHERSARVLGVLAAPPLAVLLALALLFAEGGFEPYPLRSFVATVAVVGAFLWALPPHERLLRIGGVLYLLACVLCVVVHTPVGSNVERYGVLLAGPLLICARAGAPAGRGLRAPAAALALCAAAVWTVWGPARETLAVAGSEATSAGYYAPVTRYFAGRGPVRLEVPLTRSHWEAALLAPSVPLARGWEKQLDERYDRVLLGSRLTATSYYAWLRTQAVGYVALPDVRLDASSAGEGRLIGNGLPYLQEVMRSTHWRIYRVLGATPLMSGPGRLTSLAGDSIALTAVAPGRFVIRAHYSRYLQLTRGRGCVSEARGGWTALRLDSAGPVRVAARFSPGRAFSSAPACTGSNA
jgi:hypothetical protein